MLVPPEVSRASLAVEFPSAASWAGRHSWTLELDPAALRVTARLTHPNGTALILVGEFDDYPMLAPAWRFVDESGASPTSTWPKAGEAPGLSSIFIIGATGPVICAHFNRLAYGEHGGPHGDWGAAARWREIGEGIQATTLADMLSAINRHLSVSPGILP
jgi:hypothetical protein